MRAYRFVAPLALAGFVSVAGAAFAQDTPSATNDLRLTQRVFDNFTQAYDGEPKLNISATGLEDTATVPFGRHWSLYGRGELLRYERFGVSPLVGAGVRRDGRHHMFDASVQGEFKRPIVDIDDSVGEANSAVTGVQYGYRPVRPLLLGVNTTYRNDRFELESRNARTYDAGATVRYQIYGRALMPSIGFSTGRRDSVNPADDFSQRDLIFRLQSEFSGVRLNGRYRHRLRDYTVDDARSRNFGRDDTRRQFTVSAEVPVYGDLAAVAYYAIERNRSSRAGRNFRTQMFSVGLAWRLKFLDEVPEPPEVR